MRTATRHRARGFALLDAVVGGVLLGLGLTAVIGLTASAISSQRQGERLQVAAMLADERLELVLALGPDGYASELPTRGKCEEPFEAYRFEVDIAEQGDPAPYLIRCTITWPAVGEDRSLIIETLMAPRRGDEPDPDRQPDETVGREG